MAKQEFTTGRRRVPRRSFDAAVGILLHGKYGLQRSWQVGEGGMMISCNQKITVGTLMVLNFYLPSGAIVMVRGVVRNVVPPAKSFPERYGVEFLNLGFQYKREIRNFVAAITTVDGDLDL